MTLLQSTQVSNWAPLGSLEMVIMLGAYILFLIFLYFIIRWAVNAGMREQRRQSQITNQLLAELLRQQGVNNDRIEGIMYLGNKARRRREF